VKIGAALIALAACGPRSPRSVADAFIVAVDNHDIDGVKKLIVSPEQVAQLIECTSGSEDSYYMAAGRAAEVAKRLDEYAHHDLSSGRVRLGDLWEEYDKPAQWPSYKPGDKISSTCHAKAAFRVENYRIQLLIKDSFGSKVSTKPIELWAIGDHWYVWDDPLDTEGW
jgi:hypothetical protein